MMGNLRSFQRNQTVRIPESMPDMLAERQRNRPASATEPFDASRFRARSSGRITIAGRERAAIKRTLRQREEAERQHEVKLRDLKELRRPTPPKMPDPVRPRERIRDKLQRWTRRQGQR